MLRKLPIFLFITCFTTIVEASQQESKSNLVVPQIPSKISTSGPSLLMTTTIDTNKCIPHVGEDPLEAEESLYQSGESARELVEINSRIKQKKPEVIIVRFAEEGIEQPIENLPGISQKFAKTLALKIQEKLNDPELTLKQKKQLFEKLKIELINLEKTQVFDPKNYPNLKQIVAETILQKLTGLLGAQVFGPKLVNYLNDIAPMTKDLVLFDVNVDVSVKALDQLQMQTQKSIKMGTDAVIPSITGKIITPVCKFIPPVGRFLNPDKQDTYAQLKSETTKEVMKGGYYIQHSPTVEVVDKTLLPFAVPIACNLIAKAITPSLCTWMGSDPQTTEIFVATTTFTTAAILEVGAKYVTRKGMIESPKVVKETAKSIIHKASGPAKKITTTVLGLTVKPFKFAWSGIKSFLNKIDQELQEAADRGWVSPFHPEYDD